MFWFFTTEFYICYWKNRRTLESFALTKFSLQFVHRILQLQNDFRTSHIGWSSIVGWTFRSCVELCLEPQRDAPGFLRRRHQHQALGQGGKCVGLQNDSSRGSYKDCQISWMVTLWQLFSKNLGFIGITWLCQSVIKF